MTAAAAAAAKMAEISGSQLPLPEKDREEPEPSARQRRPWGDLHMPGKKLGLTATLPETLGFYDIDAVRREREEQSAGKDPPPTSLTAAVKNATASAGCQESSRVNRVSSLLKAVVLMVKMLWRFWSLGRHLEQHR